MAKTPTAVSPPSLREKFLGLLPTLCLIHCIGTAILGSLMPAVALWMHSPWLEAGLSLLSVLLIGVLILRRRVGFDLLTGLFLSTVAVGAAGWILRIDSLRHASLLFLVGVQLLWLRQRRAQHHHDDGHGHAHSQGHGDTSCGCSTSSTSVGPGSRPGQEFA
jgi:hypothetical protein